MQYIKEFKTKRLLIGMDIMPIPTTFYIILDLNITKELTINVYKYRFKIVYYKYKL